MHNFRTDSTGSTGFTLIELLVAISVLAIVAVLGWRGLDSIVRARTSLNEELEQARGMQLAFAQMQSDCARIASSGNLGGRPNLSTEQDRLTMVRTVFTDNQPSQMQVVSYRIANGILTRQESDATRDLRELDAAWLAILEGRGQNQGQAVPLQSGVSSMTIRSWYSGQPAPVAPQNAALAPAMLAGLEVSLQLQDRQGHSNNQGNLMKIFLLGSV